MSNIASAFLRVREALKNGSLAFGRFGAQAEQLSEASKRFASGGVIPPVDTEVTLAGFDYGNVEAVLPHPTLYGSHPVEGQSLASISEQYTVEATITSLETTVSSLSSTILRHDNIQLSPELRELFLRGEEARLQATEERRLREPRLVHVHGGHSFTRQANGEYRSDAKSGLGWSSWISMHTALQNMGLTWREIAVDEPDEPRDTQRKIDL